MKHRITKKEMEEALEEMDTYFANLRATETGQLQVEINELQKENFDIRSKLNNVIDSLEEASMLLNIKMTDEAIKIINNILEEF